MADINVTYQVYTGDRWLPNVTNLTDYAGIYGQAIQGVYASLSRGSIQYRTHTQGGDWLPWVTDRTDYAGSLGKNVDGLQMQLVDLSGYNVRYRAYVGGRWLPWVTGAMDYAGIFGQPIEGIQVEIISSGNNTVTISIAGYSITMKIGDRLVSITNNYGMKGLYSAYGYSGALSAASNAMAQYKAFTGKYLYIDPESLAIEIMGHIDIGRMASYVKEVTGKDIGNFVTRTDIIDCGEDVVDSNRWVWDTVAKYFNFS